MVYHFYFKYRLGQLLDVNNEKCPENIFYEAVEAAGRTLADGVTIADYVATESVILSPLRGTNYIKDNYILSSLSSRGN